MLTNSVRMHFNGLDTLQLQHTICIQVINIKSVSGIRLGPLFEEDHPIGHIIGPYSLVLSALTLQGVKQGLF